jgi:hypothetical protein
MAWRRQMGDCAPARSRWRVARLRAVELRVDTPRVIDRALVHDLVGDQVVALVEVQHPKLLARFERHRRRKIVDDELPAVTRDSVLFSQHDRDHALGDRRISRIRGVVGEVRAGDDVLAPN